MQLCTIKEKFFSASQWEASNDQYSCVASFTIADYVRYRNEAKVTHFVAIQMLLGHVSNERDILYHCKLIRVCSACCTTIVMPCLWRRRRTLLSKSEVLGAGNRVGWTDQLYDEQEWCISHQQCKLWTIDEKYQGDVAIWQIYAHLIIVANMWANFLFVWHGSVGPLLFKWYVCVYTDDDRPLKVLWGISKYREFKVCRSILSQWYSIQVPTI